MWELVSLLGGGSLAIIGGVAAMVYREKYRSESRVVDQGVKELRKVRAARDHIVASMKAKERRLQRVIQEYADEIDVIYRILEERCPDGARVAGHRLRQRGRVSKRTEARERASTSRVPLKPPPTPEGV